MYADRLQPRWPEATVLFTDGQWRSATIIAWCRYRQTWAVLIRWPDGTEDWREYDPACVQQSFDHLGAWAEGGDRCQWPPSRAIQSQPQR
jgi:hypothetical protein